MASINFNSLPSEKPAFGTIIPKGNYLATIKKAEMKSGQDETKPPYLNIETDIVDPVSKNEMGKFWFNLTESSANLPRYQLKRFIQALNLPITGEFELKDLTKMVVNKQLMIDITPEERKDDKPAQRSIIDINAGDMFYPVETTPAPTTDTAADVFTPPEGEEPARTSRY